MEILTPLIDPWGAHVFIVRERLVRGFLWRDARIVHDPLVASATPDLVRWWREHAEKLYRAAENRHPWMLDEEPPLPQTHQKEGSLA